MVRAPVLILAVAVYALGIAAVHADELGTAGPLRMVGSGKCDGGWAAQSQGRCDPPPVDRALPPEQQSQAEVARALTLISLLRMDQAKQSLDAAIAADPRNVEAYKLRARLAIGGSVDTAAADINAGLRLAPNDPDLLATRAFLLDGEDMDGAIRDANAAIAARPDDDDALWIRARIFIHLRRFADAETDLSRALTAEPKDMRARTLRAQVRMTLNRMKDAADDAGVVLVQHPADLSARQVRAVARTELGDLPGAIDDLSAILGPPGKPINADPAVAMMGDIYLQRAILFAAAGRPDDAMTDLDSIAALGGARAILRLQVYLRGHGFPDVAIDGKRSQVFDDAIKACFVDKACGRGLSRKS